MACDEGLVERIRETLDGRYVFAEKRMFGGVCFTLNGSMMVGVVKSDLMARIGQGGYEEALKRPYVREMDFSGKPMRGYVFVASEGLAEDDELLYWIDAAARHVTTLPAKK